MTVITRFAPSPTGFLHIGGARTALFNWLFARHHEGEFLLRIEDTDQARSTKEAVDAILEGLKWLGLEWDGDPLFQSKRFERHREVAYELLQQGKAYYCYSTPEELEAMREKARLEGKPPRYNGYWRDKDPSDAPSGVKPVIRLKTTAEGDYSLNDLVQGTVTISNSQLDDMVLLRSDGTPTYMLAVVVDDHDMGITHVIRGDDHLTNAFRQIQIYQACHWEMPKFAHIPLIHGPDGAKLSKRHGALGVEAYKEMGYLPEALRNYLLRLGWSHGENEIISTKQAVEWFNLEAVGRSAARFDFTKLTNLNGHYLRESTDDRLVKDVSPLLAQKLKKSTLTLEESSLLLKGMEGLKTRAKTIVELADNALFYIHPLPLPIDEKAKGLLESEGFEKIALFKEKADLLEEWTQETLTTLSKEIAEHLGVKLVAVAQPLRAALTGSLTSPSVFEIMEVLGKPETLKRLEIAAC